MFDWLYHVCPGCGKRSRRRILSKKLKSSETLDASRTQWTRSGQMEIKEPFTVWLHSYDEEHVCRLCGHTWVEHITRQRPW